jgi:two-component system, LytTR family, response regulator
MIPAIILDNARERDSFETQVKTFCPFLQITEKREPGEAISLLENEEQPYIVFLNPLFVERRYESNLSGSALIFLSHNHDHIDTAIQWRAVGYLIKPVDETKLIRAVEAARNIISERKKRREQARLIEQLLLNKKDDRLIGIPTIEGAEIIHADEVIRCEGLQKCTRIVTCTKKDIISAYNIGEFKKLLCPLGNFFAPHRSHLINMKFVSKFIKAGAVVMKDGARVPITAENKKPFLSLITSL